MNLHSESIMNRLGNLPADHPVSVIQRLENEVKQLKDEKQTLQVSMDKLRHELSSTTGQLNTINEQLKQATATYQELEHYINFLLKERQNQKKISKLQLEVCQEKSTIIHKCEEFIEEVNRKSTKRKADAPINLD